MAQTMVLGPFRKISLKVQAKVLECDHAEVMVSLRRKHLRKTRGPAGHSFDPALGAGLRSSSPAGHSNEVLQQLIRPKPSLEHRLVHVSCMGKEQESPTALTSC